MGKARNDHTSDSAGEQLPLDDSRWLLFKVAHQRLAERAGDDELAAIHLAKALGQGLRCLHLSPAGDNRTLLPPALWAIRLMLWFGADGLSVMERRDESPHHPRRLRGWFYVWRPDFDATVDQGDDKANPVKGKAKAAVRAKPGPKPRGDWQRRLEAWIADVEKDDPARLRNVDKLTGDAQDFLKKLLRWSPSNNSRLRAEISRILRAPRS